MELINSSRTVAHLGKITPTIDYVINGSPSACDLSPYPGDTGLAQLPDTSTELVSWPGLATAPDGSYRYDPGLALVDGCWPVSPVCGCAAAPWVTFDDTWPELMAFLNAETFYRPEMAPWYNVNIPQSGEFAGFWPMTIQGLDPPSVQRQITELVGAGAVAGPARDGSKQITFSVLLIACTNAGLRYGLEWLTCQLRATNDADGVLEFFTAHPGYSSADPATLVRQLQQVVMTSSPTVTQQFNASGVTNQQETVALVSFVLTALSPYSWFPPTDLGTITWDTVQTQSIIWTTADQCSLSADCLAVPELVSATCPPEQISVTTNQDPPICGGGLPVCSVDRYTFAMPTSSSQLQCPGTVVTLTIANNSPDPLTTEGYWMAASTPEECSQLNMYPFQISGLPGSASITLDGISGTYWATYAGQRVTPVGIVSTPSGAPWLPAFLDLTQRWNFEVLAPVDADFTVTMTLYDREA